jgi:hypothetical protein
MTKNTGKPYEKLTDQVIQGLAQIKGLSNSSFQPDVMLDAITCNQDGMPYQHQIDLCWDFELDGKAHRTVFQAKDWNYRVDFPTLMTFCGVLTDLPGDPYGVIVTRTGFDGGVLTYAKDRGIGLYILDDLGQADFASCVPSVEIKIDQFQDAYRLIMLRTWHPVDKEGNYIEADPAKAADAAVACTSNPSNEVMLCNAQGEPCGTLADLLTHAHKEAQKQGLTQFPASIHHPLNVALPLYVCTDDSTYPQVQIGGLWFEVQKIPIGNTLTINSTLTHILQFCTEEENFYVDNDFAVHKAGQPFTKLIKLSLGPEENEIPFFIAFSIPIRSVKRSRKAEPRRRRNSKVFKPSE